VVLVLVLVFLGLVTGMVLESQVAARVMMRKQEQRLLRVRIHAAMLDGVRQVLRDLAGDPLLQVDALEDPYFGRREWMHPSGVALAIRVEDENRYFDLNNIYRETTEDSVERPVDSILMDLMTLCGDFSPVDRVGALRDWVDPDDEGFREDEYYRQKTPAYASPDRWLESWGEMVLVEGFDRAYFNSQRAVPGRDVYREDKRACLTVVPGERRSPVPVNVNTASRAVLLGVLGLEHENWVDYILFLRERQPIVSLDLPGLGITAEQMAALKPWLAIRSTHFRVRVRGFAEGLGITLWAQVQRDDKGQVKVLRWIY
jgi:type II secretory pathway component PulK